MLLFPPTIVLHELDLFFQKEKKGKDSQQNMQI